MKISTHYSPIDCSFHDILLDRATRLLKVLIVYVSSNLRHEETEAIITDVFTRNREEFMKLDSGELIRLDHIRSVDGIALPDVTACTNSAK